MLEKSLKFQSLNNAGVMNHANMMSPSTNYQQRFPKFQQEEFPLQYEIVEYSPDWDFVEGGAKILVCVKS